MSWFNNEYQRKKRREEVILDFLVTLLLKVDTIMGDTSRLTTDIAALSDGLDRAMSLLDSMAEQIRNIPASDQAALDALADSVEAKTAALADRVAADGPPAPPTA